MALTATSTVHCVAMARIFQRADPMREKSFVVPALLPVMLLGLVIVGLIAAWPDRGTPAEATADPERAPQTQVGTATFYGPGFQGKRTASGARFDQRKMTAAHRTLPLGTRVRVTNLDNGQSVVVLINDRGPYGRRSRIIDMSRGAAAKLDFISDGMARVRLEVLEPPVSGDAEPDVE
jgi:rare lipoprotein A